MADQRRKIEEQSSPKMVSVWTFYCGLVDFSKGVERLNKLFDAYTHHTTHFIQCAFVSQ